MIARELEEVLSRILGEGDDGRVGFTIIGSNVSRDSEEEKPKKSLALLELELQRMKGILAVEEIQLKILELLREEHEMECKSPFCLGSEIFSLEILSKKQAMVESKDIIAKLEAEIEERKAEEQKTDKNTDDKTCTESNEAATAGAINN